MQCFCMTQKHLFLLDIRILQDFIFGIMKIRVRLHKNLDLNFCVSLTSWICAKIKPHKKVF